MINRLKASIKCNLEILERSITSYEYFLEHNAQNCCREQREIIWNKFCEIKNLIWIRDGGEPT